MSLVKKLKKELNTLLIKCVHKTSDIPLVINPAPVPYDYENFKRSLLGNVTYLNKDGSYNQNKKEVISVLLDNTYNWLTEKNTNVNVDIEHILTIISDVMSNLFLWDIIGVTAMKSSCYQINAMKISENGYTIRKEIVEAKSRRLSTRYTFPSTDDICLNNGKIGEDIASEINHAVLNELKQISDMSFSINVDNSLNDLHDQVILNIIKASNQLAIKNKRGSGNWCIVGPVVLHYITMSSVGAFKPVPLIGEPMDIKFAGLINNSIKVYVDPYAGDMDDILVGYKEKDATIPDGIQYCPYLPIVSTGVLIDPTSFEQVISYMTRFGFFHQDGSNFLATVKFIKSDEITPKTEKVKKPRKKQILIEKTNG